jgi:hypothetical protein
LGEARKAATQFATELSKGDKSVKEIIASNSDLKAVFDKTFTETQNLEDYVQKGDEIIIPKAIFGKVYALKVIKVQSNNQGEPFCIVVCSLYLSKNVITFLNNLTVKRFNNEKKNLD